MTGKVRIIGGQWRGRKLTVPDRPGLRPTGDRARETVFNWLAMQVPGACCVDLFAGSGALGLEAASRGAVRVVLVERDPVLVQALSGIARDWPGGDRLEVVQADAIAWLEKASGPFDLVFVDPPFETKLQRRVLALLRRPGLLGPDARIYVESGRGEHDLAPGDLEGFEQLRCKRQGEVILRLLRLTG